MFKHFEYKYKFDMIHAVKILSNILKYEKTSLDEININFSLILEVIEQIQFEYTIKLEFINSLRKKLVLKKLKVLKITKLFLMRIHILCYIIISLLKF